MLEKVRAAARLGGSTEEIELVDDRARIPREDAQVDPVLLHTFGETVSGIVEHESNVFYICTGNAYTTHEAYLQRLDLRGWAPGTTAKPELVLRFPEEARGLNGSCLIAPDTSSLPTLLLD